MNKEQNKILEELRKVEKNSIGKEYRDKVKILNLMFEENMKTEKNPKYKKIEAKKLRTLFKRDKQLMRAKMYAEQLWRVLKEVQEVK